MEKELMTGAELSRYTGVSRAAITTATKEGRLYRDPETKKYLLSHSTNLAFIHKNKVKLEGVEITDNSIEGSGNLHQQKLQMEISLKAAQKRKLDLAFQKDKGNLIPTQLVGIFIGFFASGIQNNFLTIANKAARGDLRLKDRIDGLITKAIVKTIENASRELRKESAQITKSMEGKNENQKSI